MKNGIHGGCLIGEFSIMRLLKKYIEERPQNQEALQVHTENMENKIAGRISKY